MQLIQRDYNQSARWAKPVYDVDIANPDRFMGATNTKLTKNSLTLRE